MRPIRLPSARALILLGALFAAGAAQAQPGPDGQPGPDANRSIDITVVGGAADLERVRVLLGRRLSAVGPTAWSRADRFELADVLGPPSADAVRCWIDLRDRRRARLYFAARSGQRFLVRDVELSGNFDELDRAALAEVIELSLEALFENERAGLSRGEAEALLARRAAPPAAPPLAPARSPLLDAPAPIGLQRTRVELGVFYAVQALAAGLPVAHGPGLSVAVSTELPRDLGERSRFVAGWLTGQVRLPENVGGAQAAVRLDAIAVRAGLEVGGRELRVRLGAGADFVHVSPEAVDPSVALAAAHWSTSLALSGAVRAKLYRGHAVRLWGSLLADLLPTRVDYAVDVAGSVVPTFSPWRFRPGLALELTIP